jgi:hypothetical protein
MDKMKERSLMRIMIATAMAMLASRPAPAADVTNCGTTYLNLSKGSDQLHAELQFEPRFGSSSDDDVSFRLYGNKVGRWTCDNGNLKSFEIFGDDISPHGHLMDIDEFNHSVVIALFAAGLDAKDAIKTAEQLQDGAHHASLEDGSFTMPLSNGCKATLRIWLPNRRVSIVCG